MCSLLIVFGRFGWPLKELGLVRLVRAYLLIWADSDSASWTGWEVLTVHDEWKMALVTVLVEVERVKMPVVCPSANTEAHWESLQRDWIIEKCCADFPPIVKVQLKVGCKSSVWKSQAVGHPQLSKKLAVLTLMKALMVAVLWQSL